MRSKLPSRRSTGRLCLLSLLALGGWAHAQTGVQAGNGSASAWQLYDWLKPAEDQQRQAATGEAFKATAGQDVGDPFAVVANGSLWQEKYGTLYSRQLAETLTLTCETSSVVLDDDSEDVSRGQKVGFQFKPVQMLTLRGNFHSAANDAPILSDATATTGAGFTAEGRLPLNAVLTVGVNTDRTRTDVPAGLTTQTYAYDAQIKQPLGKLPLSAVFKSHFEETTTGGTPVSALPSLEQSLVWKPAEDTTIQAGLRQQQYQEYPGVDHQANQLNAAIFADWSQKVFGDVSWHSYAEVLNSRGLIDQAPASPLASGANGTAQATAPGSTNPASSLPISLDDQTLTFSTGPSFKLQKDLSASVEYSNRWDRDPSPGSIGTEQRVSVSLKGTF
jgi:hypothetical protein